MRTLYKLRCRNDLSHAEQIYKTHRNFYPKIFQVLPRFRDCIIIFLNLKLVFVLFKFYKKVYRVLSNTAYALKPIVNH